jgi:hypothetical protein
MLDMVFDPIRENYNLALLTEFGEELRGHRDDLARALERATTANSGKQRVQVIPADIGMALQLTWNEGQSPPGPRLRCSKCLSLKQPSIVKGGDGFNFMAPDLFHPVSEMLVFEDLDTGLIQYCCHW